MTSRSCICRKPGRATASGSRLSLTRRFIVMLWAKPENLTSTNFLGLRER